MHLLFLLLLCFSCCLHGFYNWRDIAEMISSTRAPHLFFFPMTLDFSDKRREAAHYLPAMQTLILPHFPRCSHSHHSRSFDLLFSLAFVIKRRGRCSPQIDGRSSANANPSKETGGFPTNQKVLIETVQPLHHYSSPSAPLEICDWSKGTFFLNSAGFLPPRYSSLQSIYSTAWLLRLNKVKMHWTCGAL